MKNLPTLAMVALAVSIVSLASCSSGTAEASDPESSSAKPVPVTVHYVAESAFVDYVEYYGKTEAAESARVLVPAGGRVEAVHAKVGDTVRQGDSLASVDLEQAQAFYESARLAVRLAQENFERLQKFHASGSASRIDMDNAELAWRNAKVAFIQAGRNLAGARCESPLDGYVLSRSVDLYQELAPGSAAFSVGDLASILVRVGIPEADRRLLTEGTQAEVRFSSLPDLVVQGVLESIDLEPGPASLSYQGLVRIHNEDLLVLPGATARILLPKTVETAALVVPTEALLTSSSGRYAMVARKDGERWVARKVPVAVGASNGSSTVAVSGLSSGDALIIAGNHMVDDGLPVSFDDRLALSGTRE